jgi:hypothetical protein
VLGRHREAGGGAHRAAVGCRDEHAIQRLAVGPARGAEMAATAPLLLPVDSTYKIQDAPRAHERIEAGHATGKIALVVA